MNFLDAKEVRVIKYREDVKTSSPVYTNDSMEQTLILDMTVQPVMNKIEVAIAFSKDHPSPKKLSLSAIQYTMEPLTLSIELYRIGGRKPYKVIPMEEFRTILDFEEGTGRMVIVSKRLDNEGKTANIKFSVNYVKF